MLSFEQCFRFTLLALPCCCVITGIVMYYVGRWDLKILLKQQAIIKSWVGKNGQQYCVRYDHDLNTEPKFKL